MSGQETVYPHTSCTAVRVLEKRMAKGFTFNDVVCCARDVEG